MEFVATEAAFPVLPTHLIEGAAYSSLPAHPLGIRPLPASGNRFHDHHHHHHHGKHLKPHHHGDEEEDEEDSDDADEITKSVHPPEDEDGDGDGDDEENEDDDELEEDEDEEDECRKWGLGDFARLDDATVYLVLQQLPKEDLLTLSLVSRAFYAFAEEDQLWKAFILHRGKGNCTLPSALWIVVYSLSDHCILVVLDWRTLLLIIRRCGCRELLLQGCVSSLIHGGDLPVRHLEANCADEEGQAGQQALPTGLCPRLVVTPSRPCGG